MMSAATSIEGAQAVGRNRTGGKSTPASYRISRTERIAHGQAARSAAPLESLAGFEPSSTRADPVSLLESQAQSRVAELVPIRHGRMLVSPFTYYRGAALPMAADLGSGPPSGLRVQLCGDAHLSNFGLFATPERHLVFSVNDFDETFPGPFEWDVMRLVASLAVAGRDNGYSTKERRRIAMNAAAEYRTAMRMFAELSMLDVWYAHLDADEVFSRFSAQMKPQLAKRTQDALAKARTQDSMRAMGKLTTEVDGRRRFVTDPPLIVPVEDLFSDRHSEQVYASMRELVAGYSQTLQADRRHLLDQFTLTHMARKVVGVGSVGTRAWILLMEPKDGTEPLLLQAKEAQRSVLADYTEPAEYANEADRVVTGQHLMQAASDIFLGWQTVVGQDGVERAYYVRQLKDWKFSAAVERMLPEGMAGYARICGWTLARAHARSGDRIAIAAYLGKSDAFERALADFAEKYADQNERDYAALKDAVGSGRIEAQAGL